MAASCPSCCASCWPPEHAQVGPQQKDRTGKAQVSLKQRLRRLLPTRESLAGNRWLGWLGPSLLHPRLWHASRRGVALGVAIGVFFSIITPIAQIPMSAGVAMVLRANVPWAIAGTLLNTPATFGPVYYAAWKVGSLLLGEDAHDSKVPPLPGVDTFAYEPGAPVGSPVPETVRAPAQDAAQGQNQITVDNRTWLQRTTAGLRGVGKPLLLGAGVLAVVLAAGSYLLINGIWHLKVRLKRRRRLRAGAERAAQATQPTQPTQPNRP